MIDQPLVGKKFAVLVETEYIHDEIEFYKDRIPALGGQVTFLSYLWGEEARDFVSDIDSPDRPITDVHRLRVTECVTKHDPSEFDVVICAANYVAVRLREILPMHSLGSPELTASAPAVQFFAWAMQNPRIVKAAMCHALWLLTPRPDLLEGRRVICHTVVLADVHNAGAVFVADARHVVVDDDLVTARSFSDIEAYFDAIVRAANNQPILDEPTRPSSSEIVHATADEIAWALATRFAEIPKDYDAGYRPVHLAAERLCDGTLCIPDEVKRLIGVELDTQSVAGRRPILVVASRFGSWASELTLVSSALLSAGYEVRIATEDGLRPHLLGPSLDTAFNDGAWGCPVVSRGERQLAMKYLKPGTDEHALITSKDIFDLRKIPKPPQVGEYLKDRTTLRRYREGLHVALRTAEEYEAIILVGGSGAIPGYMDDRGLHSLIMAFHKLGKPIMGECNGGLAIAQTIDPHSRRSVLWGRATTTHSWLDEYQSGWGWVKPFTKDPDSFWSGGKFDLDGYQKAEEWVSPGISGNPLIDCEAMFRNAVGPYGLFFSPAGSPYSVVVDDHLITCRTTQDGYPGVLALMAILNGKPQFRGRLFIDADECGRRHP